MLEVAEYSGWTKNKRDINGKPIECPPIPPLLELALQCKTWNSLPRAGGLLDQPYGLMYKLTLVYNINMAYENYKVNASGGREGEFAMKQPDEYALIKKIREIKNGTG